MEFVPISITASLDTPRPLLQASRDLNEQQGVCQEAECEQRVTIVGESAGVAQSYPVVYWTTR